MIEIIWNHANSLHKNETLFQTALKSGFLQAATKNLFKKEVESFLEEFEISILTLMRWMQGTSVPHQNIQDLVLIWWKKQMKGHYNK